MIQLNKKDLIVFNPLPADHDFSFLNPFFNEIHRINHSYLVIGNEMSV